MIGLQDEKWGSVPGLLIEVSDNFHIERLQSMLLENLAKYKIPQIIKIIEEIPRTSMGKIDYDKVRMLL